MPKKKNQYTKFNPNKLDDGGEKYKELEKNFRKNLEDKAAICQLLRVFSSKAVELYENKESLQRLNSKFKILDEQDLKFFDIYFDEKFNVTRWTSHAWVLYTTTLWECHYSDKFSNVIDIPKSYLRSPIISDLKEFRRNILKRSGENFKEFPNFRLLKPLPNNLRVALNLNNTDKTDWFTPDDMKKFCDSFWVETKVNQKQNRRTEPSKIGARNNTSSQTQESLVDLTPKQVSDITNIIEYFKTEATKYYYEYLHLLVIHLGILGAFEKIKFEGIMSDNQKISDSLLSLSTGIEVDTSSNERIGAVNFKSIIDDINLSNNSQTKGWLILCLLGKIYSSWEEGASCTRKEISVALNIDVNKIRLPQIGEIRKMRNILIHTGSSEYTALQIEKIYKDLMKINPSQVKIVK